MTRIPHHQPDIVLSCEGHARREICGLCRVEGIHRSGPEGARPRDLPAQINRWASLIGRIAIPNRRQLLECGVVPLGVDVGAFTLVVVRAGVARNGDWEVADELPCDCGVQGVPGTCGRPALVSWSLPGKS
jgi:hypothetical protein